MQLSETELVQGCLNNDRSCQEMLYKKYSSSMFGICLGYAKDRDDAKDILQEGFIKIFGNLKNFKGGSLEGWIRRIITHTAIDFYRKKVRMQNTVDVEEVHDLAVDVSVLEELGAKDLLMLMRQLPEGAKLIFNLYIVEGYTHKEIAEMLGVTEGTSKSQFSRAKHLLQNLISKLHEERTVNPAVSGK